MSSEAEKRASAKYDKANTTSVLLRLNKRTDADIIKLLSELDRSKMGYIKEAIREKMTKGG